jgi:ribose transport system substrate-binding protein
MPVTLRAAIRVKQAEERVMVSWGKLCAGTSVLVIAVVLAACGDDDGGSSAASSSKPGATTNASCIPAPPSALPAGADGVTETLNGAAKDALAGYPGDVYESPWGDFKPQGDPPWKVGFSNNQASLYGTGVLNGIKKQQSANPDKVSDVMALTPAKPNDVTTQIQQMRSLLQQDADIIFALLSSPTALNAVIDQAAGQDVPVISIAGQSTSKNAVNLQPNPTHLGYHGAAGLVNAMGGEAGNVLIVQAIPGLTYNTQVLESGKPVLEACGMKIVGTVAGAFDPATAKTAVLQFLASHPGKIDGVFQVSGMTPGIISAFEQVGREVPPVADINPGAPSLVYWNENKDSYNGSGVAIAPERTGEYTMALGLALLSGRGVKITDVPFAPPVVTEENLSEWVEPGWTSSTAAQANGPEDSLPIEALVDSYTSKP